MRVLHLIDGLGFSGGAERSLLEMLPRFREAGVESRVVCLRAPTLEIQSYLRNEGVPMDELEGTSRVRQVRGLRQRLLQLQPDLLHTTLLISDVLGRLAAVGTRTPVLCSLVNTTYEPERMEDPAVSWWKARAFQSLDGWTARHLTSRFHAITHAVKASAVRQLGLPSDRIEVIERGRDPERLGTPSRQRRLQARRFLGLDSEALVVVNVARQEFQKGQDVLLEAMARSSSVGPEFLVLVAGRQGHATPELERLARELDIAERIRFLGVRDDIPELLAAADLFVFPSRYEGLGGALIEAMALGLPIVASDLPAIREVVQAGSNAVLVPPEDPEALLGGIMYLLRSPELREEYGQGSREIFETRFTLERSCKRMHDLYRHTVENTRAHHD